MSDHDDEHAYGTVAPDAPVTRGDFERAIRSLNMSHLDLRNAMLNLAARVVALTDEVTRRLDGVEPLPAPPNTPAPAASMTVEAAVEATLAPTLATILATDADLVTRVSLDLDGPKYTVEPAVVPCEDLLPVCKARCCMLTFPLSTEDLDEGVIRWDYGQPYLIRQRASDGYCVHNDPDHHACTVHHHRPRVCRSYDCRKDPRVWVDFEKRIPTAIPATVNLGRAAFDLVERAKARAAAIAQETLAINQTFADPAPRKGPKPPR